MRLIKRFYNYLQELFDPAWEKELVVELDNGTTVSFYKKEKAVFKSARFPTKLKEIKGLPLNKLK